jgi:ribonuclease BN (tRNA processing enzyme)
VRLRVVGCSGSFPGPDSPASCYLVEAGGFRVLLDLGNGALGALARFVDIYAVDAVLLSHLHADHCLDMCAYYVARRYRPEGPAPILPVYGPAGSAERIARAHDPEDDTGMADVFRFLDWQPGTAEVGPLRVTVGRVTHPVDSFGMRLEHDGRVLAYSGDSGVSDALVELARDADLLLCEASFREDTGAPGGLHLTGREAGEHATRAHARRLVLTHVPPWTDPQRILAEARPAYAGPLELARPGAAYDV